MADAESNIRIDIDASGALASLKALQREISTFHSTMAKGSAAMAATSANLQKDLINNINATRQFSANMTTVRSGTESFTKALEGNKLSLGQYFKYAGASTQKFGRLFKGEFDTIEKVARERVKTLQTQYIKMGRDANGAIKAIAVRPLALDMENLATKTQMAAMKQQMFNQLVKQGSTNLLNFGKNTQWAGRQLMVGFTIPLTYMGIAAGKAFMQMEEQAIKFKRVYGEMFTTAEETDKMVNDIQNLAKEFTKYGVAVVDTMEMAAKAASMGKMGTDLLAQVTEANRLSVLGNVDQAQALETTISVTNAFGVATEELAGKINFLNAVENQTVTSIEDLTVAIPKAGPVVQQLGGNVEDLAFFLTAMKEGGINASEGANALKSGLASLINPTAKASEFLAGMGVNIKGIVEANKGNVKGIVVEFAKALDTLDPLARAQAIEQLFGKFQFSRLSTLFQNVVGQGTQAARVLELTNATAEELAILSERELKRVEESPMYKFKQAVEDLKVSLVPLGEAFVKAVTPIVQFAKDVLERFNALDEGAKSFIVGLTALLGVIGPVALMAFGLIANGAANIIKLFQGVGSIFGRVSADSKTLGLSTQYMTQEQLEAEAIASSLNQTHARLIQTFTSEAGAVDKLTAAYNRSVAAQQRAMPGMAGKNASVKKYASGVVSVPGPKGAGDVVPAMLSPGEAIIPAKFAEKYAPLINAMVSGNIPGFVKGRGTPEKNIDIQSQMARDYSVIHGKEGGAKVLLAAQKAISAEQKAIVKEMKSSQLVSKDNAAQQIKLNRAHLAAVDKSIKDARLWQIGSVTRPETMVSNNLVQTMQSSPKNLKSFASYLAKAGATEAQKANITKMLGSGRALTGKDEQLYGKALGLVDKDLKSGSATMGNRKGDAFTSGMRFSGAVSKGISAKYGALSGMDPKMATAVMGDPVKAQKIADKVAKEHQDAKVADTKATKESTKTTKKATETTKQRQKFDNTAIAEAKKAKEARSTAAKKGWETRKANAASAPVAATTPTQSGRGMAGRMGGAATTVGMVAMGASMMGGPVGDVAGQVAGPLMMVGMLFQMLPAPIAAVVAGLGLIAVAGFALKGAFDKAQDSAMKLSDTLGSGENAMRGFAEFAGNVTAGEVMDKRRKNELSMFQVQTGKTTFGESYVQGEQGKAMISGVKQSMSTMGNAATQAQMVNQLGTAVASGSLDFAQAKSIVANIASELNNEAFGINVIGKLEQMLGPNGEDLAKSPLEVRTKLIQETQKNVVSQGANMKNVADPIATLGKAALLTGELAATGALIGSAIFPGIGTAAGAVVGTVAGIATQAGSVVDSFAKMGTASGATVATGIMALQQQQEMLDSLELDYQKRIAIANAAGDTAKAEQLQNDLISDRAALLEQNKATTKSVLDTYTKAGFAGQGAMGQAVDKAIEQKYADDPLMQQVANSAKDQIVSASGLDQTQEYQMKLMLATGDLDPLTAQNLINTFGGDSKTMTNVLDVMTNLGTAEGNQALQVMNMFVDENGNPKPEQQAKFMADLAVKSPADASKYIDLFLNAKNIGNVVPLDVVMSFYQKNPKAAEAWQKQLDQINAVDGKMSMDFVQNLIGAEQFDIFKQNQAYFESLDPVQQKTYMSAFTNTMQLEGDKDMQDAYKLWLKEPGNAKKMFEDFAVAKAVKVTKESVDTTTDTKTTKAPSTGGGGKKEDPYEDILKRLKNVRLASINAQGGLKELLKIAGGKKDIQLFSGVEQQLSKLGASSQFIQYIAGADKATQKLFINIKRGVVTLTATGKAMKKAFDEAILGEFQAKLKQGTSDLKAQASGFKLLQKFGASAEEAMDMTADAAFASALASAKGKQEIARLIAAQREYNKLKKEQEERDKRIAKLKSAQEGVQESNTDFVNQQSLLSKLQADKSLTEEQVKAILNDPNLQTLYLNPTIGNAADLQKALDNAKLKAKVELDTKKLTVDGMQEIFDDGFNKAMEAFSAKEKKIELDFEVNNKGNLDTVEDTESKIAGINYQIDDYQAGLKLIEDQEEQINKKYDTKLDALDKIAKVNDKIGRQAKQQLSLADALSQGDVSAAARAVQDVKSQQSQDALDSQKDAIEAQRNRALGEVTSDVNGKKLTRVQIEESIKKLEQDIFNLEEKSLEPARERLRIAEELKKNEIERLTILGKTRAEWEREQNNVDIARTESDEYVGAMKEALDIVDDLTESYENGTTAGTTTAATTTKSTTKVTPKPTVKVTPKPTVKATPKPTVKATPKPTVKVTPRPIPDRIDRATPKPTAKPTILESAGKAVAGFIGGLFGFKLATGGMVPNYLAAGGSPFAVGTDTVPAMLTPGEFVVKRQAVKDFGVDRLKAINSGTYSGDSMYNYEVNVNVKSDANPDQIARAVMSQIRQVDAQRIRSNRL
jgi:outer membrane biosynthesis protein TonB